MLVTPMMDDWLRAALQEDLGTGDVTTEMLVTSSLEGRAEVLAKESFVVAGIEIALRVFTLLSPEVRALQKVEDGHAVGEGDILLEIVGPVRALLGGERVALNLLQHLSGVATLTRRFVDTVGGTRVKILDTRKTLPGLRTLEKYAVRIGGGTNHRTNLSEGILVKENHLRVCGGIRNAVKAIREQSPHMLRLEVEASTLEEVEEALIAGVDLILLDNMPIEAVREAVERVRGAVQLEVSGRVTLENVRDFAETGVDAISVGRLTHSAPGVDISMLLRDV